MVVVRTVDQRQQHVLKSMPSWPSRRAAPPRAPTAAVRTERTHVCSAVYDGLAYHVWERTRPERIQVCSAVYDALRLVWVDARTKRTDVCSAVYDAK